MATSPWWAAVRQKGVLYTQVYGSSEWTCWPGWDSFKENMTVVKNIYVYIFKTFDHTKKFKCKISNI